LPPDAFGFEPDAAWRVWLLLGGRGAGKTRAGAEWVRAVALGLWDEAPAPKRIALVGETHADVRRVMIEGASGLLAIHPDGERPRFESSNGRLVWPNGSVAHVFSAESPDSLRGPQFEVAWCDEIAKWRDPEAVWDMLQFALRLGRSPRVCVTTTPRPLPFLKALIADRATAVARATTKDNAAHLAPGFIAEMERRYRGAGRQSGPRTRGLRRRGHRRPHCPARRQRRQRSDPRAGHSPRRR
jgi:phage terminase large subunit-like protein